MNFCKMCGEPLRQSASSPRPGGTSATSGSSPVSTTPGGLAPVVTPAPGKPNRSALPSALAAVVGSAPTAPGTSQVKRPGNPTPTTTLRKPMIAATPPPERTQPAPAVAPAVQLRTCASCGAQTPAGFSFCQQCGGKLDSEPTMETLVPASAPSTLTDGVADTLAADSDVVPLLRKRVALAYARLVAVQRDGSDGDVHLLADDVVDLGRTDGTLSFDDRFLAPRHARLERRQAPGGSTVVALVPLDPTNGVYVRLRAGEVYPLVDGDHLLIGKEVLRFEVVEPEERALGPAMQHGVRLFGSPVRAPWGRLRQIVQTGATRDIYHLSSVQTVLGREEGDLRFADDEFMSRRHASITNRDGRFETSDLDSSNGTFVRVRGERVLRGGDVIRLGDQLLRFEPIATS